MSKLSSSNRKPEASTEVVVMRYGQHLSITPQIAAPLSTRIRRAVSDDQHGCRVVTVVEPLLGPVEPPRRPQPGQRRPIVTAGLEPIVAHMAKEAGHKVERRWYSPPPSLLPEPDLEAIGLRGPCDEQLLHFIRACEHGLIRHRAGVNRNWLIAQLVQAWPDTTFAIATAGLEPIVAHMAKEAGYKVDRRWYSPPPSLLPEPDLEAIGLSPDYS
jgi:hypothetical protein